MKKFVVVGAYISDDDTELIPLFEGIFGTKEKAQKKLEELFKDAEDYGLDEDAYSYIEDGYTAIFYKDGTREVYTIIRRGDKKWKDNI